MSDDSLNPNFEWKKKSFGKKERLSRRVDTRQALLSEKHKKNDFSVSQSVAAGNQTFGNNMRKLRKKIKDVFEEDEEDDEDIWIIDALNSLEFDSELGINPLLHMQDENKIKSSLQNKNLNDMKMQQNAAKLTALDMVNKLAQKNKLEGLSHIDIAENMQHNGWGEETFKTALEHNIAPDIKIGNVNPDAEKIKKLMKGLKRLKKLNAVDAIQGMKIDDVIKITDNRYDDKKVAKLLLKKTGRKTDKNSIKKAKIKKQPTAKISFKNLLKSKQQADIKRV